jgi:hypothetical protein
VPDQSIGGNLGHSVVSVMDPLAPLVSQSEGEAIGNIARCGGAEWRKVRHRRTIGAACEHVENSGDEVPMD